jgi:hypothetical protein
MSATINGINYSLSGSNATVTETTAGAANTTTVTIPSTVTYLGTTYNVTAIGASAFQSYTKLTSITIPNSVTSIGANAFVRCSSLASITIPNSVTTIGTSAFYGCSSLTSITIPNSVTSIGTSVFEGCSSLAIVSIGNSVLTIDDYAFYGCSSLASITIPNSVLTIGIQVFVNCSSLAIVSIGNSVLTIGDYAFYGCSSLASITIPNSVTTINYGLFYGCSKLASVTIGSSVTSIGTNAFYNCSSLASITIPNSVTTIGTSAFFYCSSLASITIPNSVTTIGDSAFAYTAKLTEFFVDINNNYFSSLNGVLFDKNQTTLIKYPTWNSRTSYTLPSTVTTISARAFGVSNYSDNKLTSLILNNGLVTIGTLAFRFCLFISIIIPDSVTTIGTSAFYGCSSLASVTFMGDIPTISSNNFTRGNDTAYYYPSTYNTPELAASRLGPIFTNLSTSPPSLKPSLSTLKSQNASKATYDSNSYLLSDLVNSGLYTLPGLKQIGYVLGELKAFFTTDTLITSWLFPGSELKQEGLIQSGITYFIIVIVFNGVFSVNRTYSSNNTNKEDTYYNVVFEGQYFPTKLSSISI